jgi:hypothetical protein
MTERCTPLGCDRPATHFVNFRDSDEFGVLAAPSFGKHADAFLVEDDGLSCQIVLD